MLLGQSIFQSVMTRLEDEQKQAEEAPPEATDFRVRGLGAGFVTPEGRPTAAEADTGAYFDGIAEWLAQQPEVPTPEPDAPAQMETPVMPPYLARLTEAEIAEDLALSPQDSETDLNEKRRQFAKLNHPDRVADDFRENATVRMKTANRMIDGAIKLLG